MRVNRRRVLVMGAAGAAAAGLGLRPAAAEEPAAPATETMYLSGTDSDHPVPWRFLCMSGRNHGVWSTIPVPSNWEFHGFGTYTWGWNLVPEEIGHYQYTFTVPGRWRDKRIFLVFEGSMTDTEVWINGQSTGPKHQGGFYRFRYEVTDSLTFEQPNLLEVTVSKDSTDSSINRAERQGDYWNFGGIYRPVYLQAHPAEHIDRLAVDARADGSFTVDVHLGAGATNADLAVAQIRDLDGGEVGPPFSSPVASGATSLRLSTTVRLPRLWTAETPNLYRVDVRLYAGKQELHQISERFGFRTVEVRAGDGVYLNGRKIVFKGTNRHTIWPDSGRATSPELSRSDILLMKEMNNNAVRMSHYPPDVHFLDLCDELGLYVIDELAGWQKPYDEAPAKPLVRSMVTRDVNHPSILFWANGNEGGWNPAVDDDFALYDPQRRPVIHPWATFSGINTDHYETYESTRAILSGSTIFMSTEFLHGLYDGGAGAGLNDYWKLMGNEPLAAGGFLWAFVDEGIVRDDRGGRIDVTGNSAPDGVLGPYREKEASYFTIKDIWSPIQLVDREYFDSTFPDRFSGVVKITNRYDFTNTRQCRFDWQLVNFAGPGGSRTGHIVAASGTATSPDIPPGGTGAIDLRLPSNWRRFDALRLTTIDHTGRELYTWVWTIKKARHHAERIVAPPAGIPPTTGSADGTAVTMTANGIDVAIDAATGRLLTVRRGGTVVSLADGPSPTVGAATLTNLTHGQDGTAYQVRATYSGDLDHVHWRLHPSGWLQLDYQYHRTGPHDYLGVSFSYPQAKITGMSWLGNGPYRAWKNRMRGISTDVWSKEHNDTATGADLWQYPEFNGFHANTYWATLRTTEAPITVVAQDENLFLRIGTPRWGWDPRFTAPPFPPGDISFLDAIPAIGTKFDPPTSLGPESQPTNAIGRYRRTLYFRFSN